MANGRVAWLLIFVLPYLVIGSGCAKRGTQAPKAVDTAKDDDEGDAAGQGIAQKILSFNLVGHRDNGEKKWELNAASADVLPAVIKLEYITAKAYGEEGSLTLKAKTGTFDKSTKDIHLEKNVIGKSSDGARLTTDWLDWNQKTECVSTDAQVRVEKDSLVSTGNGALGNPALKEVELKKDITVEIRDNPPTIITCDGPLTVNYKNNIAALNNNVKIADPRCEIASDRMKILFDPKARKITRAVAIGNVIIKREGNTTRSERAIYTVKDGRIRLIGKPRIIVN